MRVIPNMKVVVPADGVETMKAVATLIETPGPAYLRLGRSGTPVIYEQDYEFELGKASILREGNDVTIIAIGTMVQIAGKAADVLAEEGIDARVVNMSSIKPIDVDAISAAAEETGAIVTAEEHSIIGGLGSAVTEVVSETCPVPVLRIGLMDEFGRSGLAGELMEAYGLTADRIVATARDAVERKAGDR
jgi:transketolase